MSSGSPLSDLAWGIAEGATLLAVLAVAVWAGLKAVVSIKNMIRNW